MRPKEKCEFMYVSQCFKTFSQTFLVFKAIIKVFVSKEAFQ